MNIFESTVLGLVQGLTEFIPVSSSGHLEIVQQLIGDRSQDFHLFLEMINFGTLFALLFYYRKRIWKVLNDVFVKKNRKMAINLLITSIPAGVIGFLLSKLIEEQSFFSALTTIAYAMGIVGILMILIDKLPKKSTLKSEEDLSKTRALTIGLAQTFALIPGVSRSGSTIIAGRLMGLSSKSAADYSFMASIPIMIGVCLKSVVSSSSREYFASNTLLLVFSNVVAFVSGWLALQFVMRFFAHKKSLRIFGFYRAILAILILLVVTLR